MLLRFARPSKSVDVTVPRTLKFCGNHEVGKFSEVLFAALLIVLPEFYENRRESSLTSPLAKHQEDATCYSASFWCF